MSEPEWLGWQTVLAIHERQIAEHGGPAGIRDSSLLESALARPNNLLAYGEPDLFDLAAAYAVGIVRNHPFSDGNKRTALVAAVLFLELNGKSFSASEPDAAQTVRQLAAGEIDEARFAAWLRESCGA